MGITIQILEFAEHLHGAVCGEWESYFRWHQQMWRLVRRVIYVPRDQNTLEVWGVNQPMHGLATVAAPPFTDADDPLGRDCSLVLIMPDGDYVTWDRMFEWLGLAEAAGYTVVSGFADLSPYSTIVLRASRPHQ